MGNRVVVCDLHAPRHEHSAGDAGSGWPDPATPGVPLPGRFHWLSWQSTGVLTIGEWVQGFGWVISYLGRTGAKPPDMAHLNYLGRILPEPIFTRTRDDPQPHDMQSCTSA
jgi:hypothetical protein